jgi:hypothetical protein
VDLISFRVQGLQFLGHEAAVDPDGLAVEPDRTPAEVGALDLY